MKGSRARSSARQRDQETVRLVNDILDHAPVDGVRLRKLAAVRGLVTPEIRGRAWPLLLGISHVPDALPPEYYELAKGTHKDTSTVKCDVERSLWAFTPGWTQEERGALREALSRLLTATVVGHAGTVHYYQGLHDVAGVLLLVAGEHRAYIMLQQLATHHLKPTFPPCPGRKPLILSALRPAGRSFRVLLPLPQDCTTPDLQPVMASLALLLPLLRAADPEVGAFVDEAGVQPFFAVSWLLTWFAHDVDDVDDASRLFDLFLSCHPLMPLYAGVASIISQRGVTLGLEKDHGIVHSHLSKLKILDGSLSADELAHRAIRLHVDFPPGALELAAGVTLPKSSASRAYPFPWQSGPPQLGRIRKLLVWAWALVKKR